MAMCPDGGLLLLGSTVHRQRGLMYRLFKTLYGVEDQSDVCWFAPPKMNPLLRQSVIDAAMASDPTAVQRSSTTAGVRPDRVLPARLHRSLHRLGSSNVRRRGCLIRATSTARLAPAQIASS